MSAWPIVLAATMIGDADLAGRALYQFGQADPPILSSLPGESRFSESPPMACAACHGTQGMPSGELSNAPDLARLAATAGDSEAFAAVLQRGIGRDGHVLRLMPRYAVDARQRSALATYLRRLAIGDAPEPGVTSNEIVIDISMLPDTLRQELIALERARPATVYGRHLRLSTSGQEIVFARIVSGSPGEAIGDDPPEMPIAASRPGVGRAALLLLTEVLRRTGRRLTRPAFSAVLDELRHPEQSP